MWGMDWLAESGMIDETSCVVVGFLLVSMPIRACELMDAVQTGTYRPLIQGSGLDDASRLQPKTTRRAPRTRGSFMLVAYLQK